MCQAGEPMPAKPLAFATVVFCLFTNPLLLADPASQTDTEKPADKAEAPEAEQPSKPDPHGFLSLDSPTMTGDWGGLRSDLEEHGVKFNLFHTARYQSILKGGRDMEGGDPLSASIDVLITFDFEKLGLMKEADALIHIQSYWEDGINLQTGALHQVNDDADGDLGAIVAQFWFRKHFLDRRISLRMGYLDYQTIIDRNAYANSEDKQFWSQILDNNPLVPLNIGMGASLTLRPTNWYTLILGVGDAQSVPYKGGITTAFHDEDWYRAFMEHGFHVKLPSERGELPGNYRLGLIYDPIPRAVFPRSSRDNRLQGDDYGFYLSFDQMLFRESEADDQGLGVFFRFAYRKPEVHRMSRFYSAGAQYKGLIPDRDKDVLGFAFAKQRSSHPYRHRVNWEFSDETLYELYYAIQVTKWLVLSPDIQYVDNPGATGEFGHVITAGLRARISF